VYEGSHSGIVYVSYRKSEYNLVTVIPAHWLNRDYNQMLLVGLISVANVNTNLLAVHMKSI
jgi:hypothetical protein